MSRTIHIVASGFLQRVDEVNANGMVRLAWELEKLDCTRHAVREHAYKDDYRQIANRLLAEKQERGPIRVRLYGYSYGGWWCMKLSWALSHRGIVVDSVVLSDPVRRYPHPVKWLALLPAEGGLLRIPLTFPDSCLVVKHFYQRQNLPCGFDVRLRGCDVPGAELRLTHQHMDNSERFHEACLSAAQGIYDLKGKCEL